MAKGLEGIMKYQVTFREQNIRYIKKNIISAFQQRQVLVTGKGDQPIIPHSTLFPWFHQIINN